MLRASHRSLGAAYCSVAPAVSAVSLAVSRIIDSQERVKEYHAAAGMILLKTIPSLRRNLKVPCGFRSKSPMNRTSHSTPPTLQSDGGGFFLPLSHQNLNTDPVCSGEESLRARSRFFGARGGSSAPHSLQMPNGKTRHRLPASTGEGCGAAACRGWIPATCGRRRRRTMPRTILVLPSCLFLAIVATDIKAAFGHPSKSKEAFFSRY